MCLSVESVLIGIGDMRVDAECSPRTNPGNNGSHRGVGVGVRVQVGDIATISLWRYLRPLTV